MDHQAGRKTEFASRIGLIKSSNLSFDFRSVYNNTEDAKAEGTYTLAESNRTGNWVGEGSTPNRGTFKMTSGDTKSFAMTYVNSTTGETGVVTGTFLQSVTIADVKGKSFTIYKGCANGSDNTVTIGSTGLASDTCGSNVNGATFSAGPFTNTLQFVETSGARHYLGITRLNKGSGSGNLPSGSTGTFMDISSANYQAQTSATSFKVN